MEIKLSFVILLTTLLVLSLSSAFGYTTKDIPEVPVNYSQQNVNNSYWLRSLSPQQVADLYTETDPIWTANSSLVAYYQFLNNNFNGSGNFTGNRGNFNSINLEDSLSDGTYDLTVVQLATAYGHSQIAGGNSVHVSTTENTNWDTGYSHSQISGGIHEDWTDSTANINTTGTGTFGINGIYLADSGFHLNLRVDDDSLDEDAFLEISVGGATPYSLLVSGVAKINQDVQTTASPTWVRPTVDRLNITASTTNTQLDIGTLPFATGGAWDTISATHPQAGARFVSNQPSASNQGAGFILYSHDGAYVGSGHRLGFFLFGGSSGASTYYHGAGFSAYADQTWSSGSAPTRFQIELAPPGSTSRSVGLKINSTRSVFLPGIYNVHADERAVFMEADGQLGWDSSSLKYKENVKNLTQSDINKILQLRSITYNKIGSEDNEYGFIAEEVNELFPELISYKSEQIWKCIDDGMGLGDEVCDVVGVELVLNKTTGKPIPETISYRKISVLAIELAQDLKQENQVLNQTIQDLIKRIEVLEKSLIP